MGLPQLGRDPREEDRQMAARIISAARRLAEQDG
jgi:hypothetical protein